MSRVFTRFGLLEAFISIVTLLFLVLTLLDFFQTLHAAQTQAEGVLTQAERTVTVEVQRVSAAARTLIAQLDQGERAGILDFRNPAAIYPLLTPAMREYAILSSVNQGDAAGNGFLLLKTEGGWSSRLKRSAQPSQVTWVTFDAQGRETARSEVPDNYDPRRRPWYLAAPASGAVVWGAPYILRTTGDLGITVSKAVSGGVVGVDIKLKDLSSFLASTGQWTNTAVLVTDAQGKVLASSAAAQFGARLARSKAHLPSLEDADFRDERAAVQLSHRQGKRFCRLNTPRGALFARVSDISLDAGSRVRVILTVPRSVFMESFSRGLAWKITAYLALLLSASLFYLKRYIFPLKQLVRLIGEVDYSRPRFFPDSRRGDEIGVLHSHMNDMAAKVVEAMTALKSSEEHYRLLAENMQDVIWRSTPDYLFSYLSPSDETVRGFPAAQVLGRPIWDTLCDPFQEEFRELARRQGERLERGHRYATEVLQAEQLTSWGTMWVEMVCTPVYDQDGRLAGFQGVTRDISARRAAEEEVRSARNYLNGIVNVIADPVFVKDEGHRLVLVNDAECALAGCSRDELLGKTDYDFFPAEQVDGFWKVDDQVLHSGECSVNEEVITDAATGLLRTVVTRKTRYVDPAGHRFIVGVIRDITDLREAQTRVIDNARRAGMAEIATNVLHSVGNVLNSINVSAEELTRQVRSSRVTGLARAAGLITEHASELGEYLTHDEKGRLLPEYLNKVALALAAEQEAILSELDRLTRSVDHVKAVVATQQRYAGASSIIETVRVTNLLEDALYMNAEALVGQGIRVVREFAEVPELPLDKARVMLILLNLIKNAKHAMAEAAGPRRQLTLRVAVTGDASRRRLRICIADDGVGISAENLTRIFTHGFTTRSSGHGFGLHSCAMAAKEMGGTLKAHSEGVGRGAVFTLEIPINT